MAGIATKLVWVSVAACAAYCAAQQPSTEPRTSVPAAGIATTDAEGTPLPPGVVARLGSTRWRHGGTIIGSALSSDGKRLATASIESIAVWDLPTGKVLFRFTTRSGKDRTNVSACYAGPGILAMSPDGKKLAHFPYSPGGSGVWDLEKGTFQRFAGGDANSPSWFAADSQQVVLNCGDRFHFYDLARGNLQRGIRARPVVEHISADLRLYIQLDRSAKAFNVCDVQTGALIKQFDIGPDRGTVGFAPDSKTLVLIDHAKRKEIQVWAMPAAKLRWTIPLPKSLIPINGNPDDVRESYCIGFSADSERLMMSIGNGNIHRWDLARYKELPTLHRQPGAAFAVYELPGGKTLLETTHDGLIRHWDIATSRELFDLGNYHGFPKAIFAPDGRVAAVADLRGRVDLWDMRSLKLLRTLRRDGPVPTKITFAPDSKTLAVGLDTQIVVLYEVASGRQTKAIQLNGEDTALGVPVPSSMVFSPDGHFLCVNTTWGELCMLELAQGKSRWRLKGDWCTSGAMSAFGADGKTLAVAPHEDEVALLDALTGKALRRIRLGKGKADARTDVVQLAAAPVGARLAACLADETVVLLDALTMAEVRRLSTGSRDLRSPVFSPDGRFFACGVAESISVWDTTTGQLARRLDGHQSQVLTVSFGADGRTLLSAGEDSQVYLWLLGR